MPRVGYDKQTKTLYGDFRSNTQRNAVSTRSKLNQHAAKYNNLSAKQQRQVAEGLNKWATNFENHYQKGLSKGMNHAQAEAYANKAVSGPTKKRRRK